ncbi:predicted protein [Chaetomium globosum CBS 148.51]|uniref:Uncharacterized protein n=1 Tax=Chaetomium globosum (strain ATCC 6205 / CBS 148.51 / DSM 1962 / NBRC 6347 / NRRL 1970) TaxID=306901 RepID=Q2H9H2_CHAGB|nr:uncharacterized protein CHGG_03132 [Chaetomium globosum CBS 148.51]EAQ91197.1 predicted protein [Chaetomium globosum CBS 148.51]
MVVNILDGEIEEGARQNRWTLICGFPSNVESLVEFERKVSLVLPPSELCLPRDLEQVVIFEGDKYFPIPACFLQCVCGDLILALDSTEELDDAPHRKGHAVGVLPVCDVGFSHSLQRLMVPATGSSAAATDPAAPHERFAGSPLRTLGEVEPSSSFHAATLESGGCGFAKGCRR